MKQTLILLGLSAVAFASTGIKNRLAQQAAASCSCSLPGTTGSGLPPLGEGSFNGWSQGTNVNQGSTLTTVPDTEVTEQSASECCSCNTGSHASASAAQRTRHYDITGSISIAESVEWSESGNSTAQSAGEAQRQSTEEISNLSNNNTIQPGGRCVTVCSGTSI
jgi:hypothetical protein